MVSFVQTLGLVIFSSCYTFFVAKLVPKGTIRLILFSPAFLSYFIVPFLMSSLHLVGITAFFIAWLANFKLFLLVSDNGPLSSNVRPLSLPLFLAVSCLPIKIQVNPTPSNPRSHGVSRESYLIYTIKAVLLVLNIKVYDYSSKLLPEKALLALYAIHTYFTLELILAVTAALVRGVSGLELEPQFNKPYLATSLQEFWGRRWNLMVTRILRPAVYEPLVQLFSVLGPDWSQGLAVFGAFVVSGIMHELIFFYIGRMKPDWKVMLFFLINGLCTTLEIVIKKNVDGRLRPPTVIRQVLTLGFVMVTVVWLFLPEFIRCNMFERAFQEYALIGEVAAGIKRSIITSLFILAM